MPFYVYEVILEDGEQGQQFEVMQKMSDPALTTHPTTGQPVRRVITAPNIGGDWSETRTKNRLSDKNLDRLGFTKYVRSDDGKLEKVAGKGPKDIQTGA